MKKVAFLLALVLSVTSVFTGCEKKTSKEAVNVEVIDFNQYSDSEEIPDWEGGKLKLVKWADANAANTYQKRYKQGKDDAVAAEFDADLHLFFLLRLQSLRIKKQYLPYS